MRRLLEQHSACASSICASAPQPLHSQCKELARRCNTQTHTHTHTHTSTQPKHRRDADAECSLSPEVLGRDAGALQDDPQDAGEHVGGGGHANSANEALQRRNKQDADSSIDVYGKPWELYNDMIGGGGHADSAHEILPKFD